MEIDEPTWSEEVQEAIEEVTWSSKDYGTSRLVLPGVQGPKWSSCTRRFTVDLDSGEVVEDRPVSEVVGRVRRREFRGGGRNIETTFTYQASRDVQPHQWERSTCGHCGWLRAPGICEACGGVGRVRPVQRASICVVYRDSDGTAMPGMTYPRPS